NTSTGVLSATPLVAGTFPFTVQATDQADHSATTGPRHYALTVNPGPPAQLKFVTQPTSVTAGSPFSPSPVVRVMDAEGNLVKDGAQVNNSIAALAPTMIPVAPLGGMTTVGTSGGLAVFNDLSETTAGSYALTALVPGHTATSMPFTVTPATPTVTVTASPSSPKLGSPLSVTITVKDQYQNGWTLPASLTASDGLSPSPQNVPVTNGTGMTTITLTNAHTITLTATVMAGGVTVNGSVAVNVQTV